MNHRTQSELEITAILNQSVETRSRRKVRDMNSIFIRERMKSNPKLQKKNIEKKVQRSVWNSQSDNRNAISTWSRRGHVMNLYHCTMQPSAICKGGGVGLFQLASSIFFTFATRLCSESRL